jgi:hypothetical protein
MKTKYQIIMDRELKELQRISKKREAERKFRKLHRTEILAAYRKWYYTVYRKPTLQVIKAHSRLNWAIKTKKIDRPNVCSICKENKRIVGHHQDYAKPLKVLWICHKCHKAIHNKKQSNLTAV